MNKNFKFRDLTRKMRANLSFIFNTNEIKYKKSDYKIINKIYLKATKIKFSERSKSIITYKTIPKATDIMELMKFFLNTTTSPPRNG